MRASLRDRRQRETELVGCWKQQGAGGGDGSWGKRADTGAPEQHGGLTSTLGPSKPQPGHLIVRAPSDGSLNAYESNLQYPRGFEFDITKWPL